MRKVRYTPLVVELVNNAFMRRAGGYKLYLRGFNRLS